MRKVARRHCPECGSADSHESESNAGDLDRVECRNCGTKFRVEFSG